MQRSQTLWSTIFRYEHVETWPRLRLAQRPKTANDIPRIAEANNDDDYLGQCGCSMPFEPMIQDEYTRNAATLFDGFSSYPERYDLSWQPAERQTHRPTPNVIPIKVPADESSFRRTGITFVSHFSIASASRFSITFTARYHNYYILT
jgi:hypothetical protein